MMRFLFVIASVVVAALAQLTVNTPEGVFACTNFQVSWTGGTGPFILSVVPGGQPSATPYQTFTGISASPYTWYVAEQANTQVFLRLEDSTGTTAESGTFTIGSAGATCTSSASGATTAAAGATTPAVVTTAAGTTTPAAGVTTTPAAGATTTPAAGATTTHATTGATTTSTHSGGVSSLQMAGGLVGLVGAVAVALA